MIKLNEFNISYRPMSFMKVQILANFLIECTWPDNQPEGVFTKHLGEQLDLATTWILHIDGALNFIGSKVRLILINS